MMRQFSVFYLDFEIVQQLAAQLPWPHFEKLEFELNAFEPLLSVVLHQKNKFEAASDAVTRVL